MVKAKPVGSQLITVNDVVNRSRFEKGMPDADGDESEDFAAWVKRVWQVVLDIPRGCVLTYGEVARLAGTGGSARRVGQALGRAPKGMKLPWHRVINSQGKISFPADSPSFRKQKSMLEKEGVVFLKGKTDLERFGYAGTVDRLLWGESEV